MVALTETQQATLRAAQGELRQAEESIVYARLAFARQHGFTFNGARDTYGVFGYATEITSAMYRERYERGGLATRVIDARPSATWRGEGELYENEKTTERTEFENTWYALNDKFKIWPLFQRVDRLASLGEHAAILIGAEGNLDTELPLGAPDKLIGLWIFDDDDCKINEFETDIRNERWGQPKNYTLKRTDFSMTGRNKTLSDQFSKPVHYSRIVHIPAEGFLEDEIYGPPGLQNVWNYLDDLDKTVGGGAEAFFHRANQGTHFNIDKDATFENEADFDAQVAKIKAQAEAYKHQLTRWITTRGVDVKQLGSDTADFKGPKDAIVSLIAGTKGIPQRILLGAEAGSLASDQDRDNWNDQIGDRRTSYAGPYIVRQTVDRLIKYRYMPTPKQYSTRWPDVRNMSMQERLDAAAKAAALNDHGQLVITNDEIRETYLERAPLTPEQIDEVNEQKQLPAAEEQQVDLLAAQLRKGGTLSIAVRQ